MTVVAPIVYVIALVAGVFFSLCLVSLGEYLFRRMRNWFNG